MIGSNIDDYSFINIITLLKSGAVFTITLWILLSIVCILLYKIKIKVIPTIFSLFCLYWIVLSGLLFPLSISTVMVEPVKIPVDKFNLFLLSVTIIILLAIAQTKIKKFITIFISVTLITSAIPSIISIYKSDIIIANILEANSLKTKIENNQSLQISNKRNIFVISFDGIPGRIITNILKENESFASELKDFIVFDNAVAQAPATEASMMGELYGTLDFKAKGKSVDLVKETLYKDGSRDKLITKHILDSYHSGYHGYGIKPILVPFDTEIKSNNKLETLNFFKYPIVRIWTSHFLKHLDWEKNLSPFRKFILPQSNNPELNIRLSNHKGAKWDVKNIQSILLFNKITSSLSVVEKKLSVRYVHTTFTHFPVDFDENCKYKSDEKSWFKNYQNEKGIKNQSICAVKKFIEFINKLKDLKVYDNSTIIFKSDHGKPSNYFDNYPQNLRINGSPYWGYSRYRPALMIKGYNSVYSHINYKKELVLINDIAKTLCEIADIKLDCTHFKGANLLETSQEFDEPYYIYVPKDKNSGGSYVDLLSVRIPSRKISFLKALENSSSIELSQPKKINK